MSDHILTHQTKPGVVFSCHCNCILVVMVTRTATSGWPRGILFAHKPTLLQPAWRWHRLCVAEPRQNGFDFPGTAAWSVGPRFVPADAHSSCRGLLMTCSSLEEHWGCCERVRTTPRNLTEPLWQRADVRKQLEQSGQAW